jgi:hypothetical protein
MTISSFVRASAGALAAAAIYVAGAGPGGATTLTLTNPSTQSDTPMTVVFTATSTESMVIDQGYQVNDIEKLTNNMVTLTGGGPNLLGSSWGYAYAAAGSNSYTFNDGSSVPALGFAGQNPLYLDTFYQRFATVRGDTYTYSFNYWNNTAGFGAAPSKLVVTAISAPEASTWILLLLGFAGLGFASRRGSRMAGAVAG